MRVVHIIKVIRAAGAEQHLLTLLAGLRQRQVDARLLLLVEPQNPMQSYVEALQIRDVPVERMVIQHHADPTLLPRLMRKLRQLKPDVVHTHLIHADLYGTLAARLTGVRLVVSSRHNDDSFRRRAPVRLLLRGLWSLTDAGIAISDAIATFSIEVEGAPAEKIRRIHYGLENTPPLDRAGVRQALLGELRLPADALLVGMVCRLVEQKGVTYGLRAFANIAADFPSAHLLIVGEGPLHDNLMEAVIDFGLTERVHFLGWRADTPRLLAGLDGLLAPSLWEGFGLVLLEAMQQATPIIASAVSAIPEVVVTEQTGLLVAPRDVDGLTGALRRLLADDMLRRQFGTAGRVRLETAFSATTMVEATLTLYQQLATHPRT